MDDTDNLTLEELKKGYIINSISNTYQCVCCGAVFEDGEIFRFGERFFNAERAIKLHMAAEHPSRLKELLDTCSLPIIKRSCLHASERGLQITRLPRNLG